MEIVATLSAAKSVLDIIRAVKDLKSPSASVEGTNEVVLGLGGSILFELHDACQRTRLYVELADQRNFTYIILNLEVTDAVLPELARLAPAPRILVPTTQLLAQLRLIDHFLRAASTTPPSKNHTVEELDPRYNIALGHARGFLKTHRGVERFNEILDPADVFGRAVFDKDPSEKLSFLLPDRIDLSKPVPDHLR